MLATEIYNLYLTPILYNLDVTPIFFVITFIVYVWGFSKLKLIETIPIAKDIVFENMSDPVFVLDIRDRIVDTNPVALKIFDYTDSGMIGEKFEEIFSNQHDLVECIQDKKETRIETFINIKNERHYFDIQINPLRNNQDSVKGCVISLRDISDLKKAQQELRKFNEELEQKVKERTAEIEKLLRHKDEFINQLGHDLKSPLTPLIGLLPTVEQQEKDPELKELLVVANRNVKYMRDLVVKTLQLEQLNSPNNVFNITEVNLSGAVDDILKNKKLIFEEKVLIVENNVDKEIVVSADKVQLVELFDNLITNAVKFTPKDGAITIDARKDGDFVVVSVADTGIGLTLEQMYRVFDEFYKVDPSRHDLDSSGLGLSICKRIVEKHGGRIWVESLGPGKGATFYFIIPTKY